MKTLLMFMVVPLLNLVVFAWFNRVALVRILALRQQLTVYKRKTKKPRLRNRDRLFWSLLSKVWRDWASELIPRDRNQMEEKEVSGVLAEKIPGQVGQTGDS